MSDPAEDPEVPLERKIVDEFREVSRAEVGQFIGPSLHGPHNNWFPLRSLANAAAAAVMGDVVLGLRVSGNTLSAPERFRVLILTPSALIEAVFENEVGKQAEDVTALRRRLVDVISAEVSVSARHFKDDVGGAYQPTSRNVTLTFSDGSQAKLDDGPSDYLPGRRPEAITVDRLLAGLAAAQA